MTQFLYEKTVNTRVGCTAGSGGGIGNVPELPGNYIMCTSLGMYSNTLYNLVVYPGSTIQYEFVTESNGGSNFENGGIQHKYTISEDVSPNPILGEPISGAPYSNYSIYSGREIEQLVFDKNLNPVEKTISEYTDDPGISRTYKGYSVSMNNALPTQQNLIPLPEELDSYNYTQYEILTRWIYKSKETTYSYNSGGSVSMTSQAEYQYNNRLHALPTKVTTHNSKGEKKMVVVKYPSDYPLSAVNWLSVQANLYTSLQNGDNAYNNCITTFNQAILPLFSQMSTIRQGCYQQIMGNCSLCSLDCNDINCIYQWNEKIGACTQTGAYNSLSQQLNNHLASYQCESNWNAATLSAINNYWQSIGNHYSALDAAINSSSDEHTRAILTMQRRNMLDAVVEKTEYKIAGNNQQELGKVFNKFRVLPNGDVVPAEIQSSLNGASAERKLSFEQYDAKSNITQHKGKDGITQTIIWGYNYSMPVARALYAIKYLLLARLY